MKKFTNKINESKYEFDDNVSDFFNQHIQKGINNTHSKYLEVAILFAKDHVKKALEEANRLIIENDDLQSDIESGRLDINDIYPLENIK